MLELFNIKLQGKRRQSNTNLMYCCSLQLHIEMKANNIQYGGGGVAAWRRGGVAAWRRGGVAAWRRGGG